MENPVNPKRKGKIVAWMLGITSVAVAAAIVLVALGARTPRFEMARDGLHISNSLFGRTIPRADIDPASARIVDLDTSPELAPRWRTFGVGLPGRQSGWYLLRNGSDGLLFLTRSDRVLYFKTHKGTSVLISPEDPEEVLRSMKQ